VAGTVGLMMCGVLGVKGEVARRHAIDLGVAMQLTNIARDVAEDARMGRVYLPRTRLEAAGTSPEALLEGRADPAAVSTVVRDLLAVAEVYYRSADAGMPHIPFRSRVAVLAASRLYRQIGRVLLARGADPLEGRTVVGWFGKAAALLAALGAAWFDPVATGRRRVAHDAGLHAALHGFFGVNG
jgi:phytoene synthase